MSSRAIKVRVEAGDRFSHRRPFLPADPILRYAGLKAALVFVGTRVADVLVAVGLGKENAEADAARDLCIRRIEALGARDRGGQVDDVVKRRVGVLRIRGRRLHDGEEILVLVEQRLVVGIEIGGRNAEFVGPADSCRQQVGEVFVRTHHGDAREVESLSRKVRQRLIGLDLRTALVQDGFELGDRVVIAVERIRLRFGERGRRGLG